MKRLCLITLSTVLLSPLAAQSETFWLIMSAAGGSNSGGGIEKIEVSSMRECLEQGELFKASSFRLTNKYVCLKDKLETCTATCYSTLTAGLLSYR